MLRLYDALDRVAAHAGNVASLVGRAAPVGLIALLVAAETDGVVLFRRAVGVILAERNDAAYTAAAAKDRDAKTLQTLLDPHVLFVVANTPVSDPCSNGGTARLFALDPVTGALPKFPVFDVDDNKVINASDEMMQATSQILR